MADILFNKVEPQLDKIDYVYTFGTTVSKITKGFLDKQVPQIFDIVSLPVQSNIVQSLQKPGENISGASHAIPLEQQMQNAAKFLPFQRLGMLFNPREENSNLILKQLEIIAEKEGFEIVHIRTAPEREMLEEQLQAVASQSISVDAVYLPSDSFMVSQAEFICAELNKANVPTIGGIQGFIEQGALLGTVTDYYATGKLAAHVVDRHQKGEQMGDIPVQTPQETTLLVNKKTLEHLGLTIPQALVGTVQFFE